MENLAEIAVREWLASTLREESIRDDSTNIHSLLKDGVLLCRAVNLLSANVVPQVHSSFLPFKQMENINSYLTACVKLGFAAQELFDVKDLYEQKDMDKVVKNILVLRTYFQKYDPATLSKRMAEVQEQLAEKERQQKAKQEEQRRQTAEFSRRYLEAHEDPALAGLSTGTRLSIKKKRALPPTPNSATSSPSTPSTGSSKRHNIPLPVPPTAASPTSPPTAQHQISSPPPATPNNSKGSLIGPPQTPPVTPKTASTSRLTSSGVLQATPSVTSLEDDLATKKQFKYSPELEQICKRWIEAVIKESMPSTEFAEALKSGVVLCSVINAIKPGTITKINSGNVAYSQMENIDMYLKACKGLGIRDSDLFDTIDLFEQKDMPAVLNHIVVLANTVVKMKDYTGPKIEDSKNAKSLWSESLAMNELDQPEPEYCESLTPEHRTLLNWVNQQLSRCCPPVLAVTSLSQPFRSGILITKLIEVVTGVSSNASGLDEEAKYLWQYIPNVTAALRFLQTQTFEEFRGCTARDIVAGDKDATAILLRYIRDKFDLEFLYNTYLEEEVTTPKVVKSTSASSKPSRSGKISSKVIQEEAVRRKQAEEELKKHREEEEALARMEQELRRQQEELLLALKEDEEKMLNETDSSGDLDMPVRSPKRSLSLSMGDDNLELPNPLFIGSGRHPPPVPARDDSPDSKPLAKSLPQQPWNMRPGTPPPLPYRPPLEEMVGTPKRPKAATVGPETSPPVLSHSSGSLGTSSPDTTPEQLPRKGSKIEIKRAEKEEKKRKKEEEKKRKKEDALKKKEAKEAKEEEKKRNDPRLERRRSFMFTKKKYREGGKGGSELHTSSSVKKAVRPERMSVAVTVEEKSEHRKSLNLLPKVGKPPKAVSREDLATSLPLDLKPMEKADKSESAKKAAAAQKGSLSPKRQERENALQEKKARLNAHMAELERITKERLNKERLLKEKMENEEMRRKQVQEETHINPNLTLRGQIDIEPEPTPEPEEESEETKKEKARAMVRFRVISELLKTEESYVRGMDKVVTGILHPLRRTAQKGFHELTEGELQQVFCNVEEILDHHNQFLGLIQDRVGNWNVNSTIGDIFLNHADFMLCYKPYMNNYNTALIAMCHLGEKTTAFKEIKETFEKVEGLTLESFLITPIQRIPRYLLLLRECNKYCPKDHPDFELTTKAMDMIGVMIEELNRDIDENAASQTRKVITIAQSIEGKFSVPGEEGLYKAGRYVVREGFLFLKIDRSRKKTQDANPMEARRQTRAMINKRFYFFLFNDILVVCAVKPSTTAHNKSGQPAPGGVPHTTQIVNPNATNTQLNNSIVLEEEGEPKFTFAEYMFLRDVQVVDTGPPKDEKEWMKQLQMCTFHIATDQVCWTITAKTIEERDSWTSTLQKLCPNVQQMQSDGP